MNMRDMSKFHTTRYRFSVTFSVMQLPLEIDRRAYIFMSVRFSGKDWEKETMASLNSLFSVS